MDGIFMRKLIFALALFGIVNASHATWFNAVNVGAIQIYINGRVFFQTTGFATTRWWTFDGSTAGGKNMYTMLLTAKSTNLPIRFDGLDGYTNSDRPTSDTFNCKGLQYP
jgi:hypothetical protein